MIQTAKIGILIKREIEAIEEYAKSYQSIYGRKPAWYIGAKIRAIFKLRRLFVAYAVPGQVRCKDQLFMNGQNRYVE